MTWRREYEEQRNLNYPPVVQPKQIYDLSLHAKMVNGHLQCNLVIASVLPASQFVILFMLKIFLMLHCMQYSPTGKYYY